MVLRRRQRIQLGPVWNLVTGRYDLVRLLHLFLVIPNVGHVDILLVLFVNKNIALNKLETLVIWADIDRKERRQKVEKFVLVDVRIVLRRHWSDHNHSSEKIGENLVQNGVLSQHNIDGHGAAVHYLKKVNQQRFILRVFVLFLLITILEVKLEPFGPYQLVNLFYVALIINIIDLETQLQVLVVKYADVGLRVIRKMFDNSRVVDQIGLEKLR